MKVPLINTNLTYIKYYLILHYTKLGMTISVHSVLKNSNKFKEHQIIKIFYMWSKLLNRVNLVTFILLEYLK